MEYVKLNNEVSLSRIIQGMWRLQSWNWTTDQLIEFMEQCIDRGVTTFDTAEIYGRCEELMGEALMKAPHLREKIQIVTKTNISIYQNDGNWKAYYDSRYDNIMKKCQQSIDRLHCGYIDVYLIHREDPCINPHEVATALKELKEKGLIKAAGVSNFDPYKFEALNKCMDYTLVTNQIEMSPVCFEHFETGMVDVLTRDQIPPMIWSPLAGGSLFTSSEAIHVKARAKLEEIAKKYDTDADTIAYAWLMYHPMHAMPISGSSKIERLDAAIKALDIKLEHQEWYEIYTASGQKVLR